MNKKEEIKYLKKQLKYYKSISYLAKEVLEPYKRQSLKRGTRMQKLMKQLKKSSIFIPQEFYTWFDKDGNPLL